MALLMSTMWILLVLCFKCLLIESAKLNVIDLSHDLNNSTFSWPTGTPFKYLIRHRGLVNPDIEESDGNYWYEINDFIASEHTGTHLDAPAHFGRGQWSTDEIPSDRFIAPVSIIDLRDKVRENSDYEITAEDLKTWEKMHHPLKPMIILWTGWSSRWSNTEKYIGTTTNDSSKFHFPGLHPDGAQLLANRDLYGVGIDTPSIDYGQSKFFASHKILSKKNIFQLENINTVPLANTSHENLLLIVNPLKITTGSGSPLRLLAVSPFTNNANTLITSHSTTFFTIIAMVIDGFYLQHN